MNSPHLLSLSYQPHHQGVPVLDGNANQSPFMLTELNDLYFLVRVGNILPVHDVMLIKPVD